MISGRFASACNQRTSTVTRAWIKPNSERKGVKHHICLHNVHQVVRVRLAFIQIP
jgi:hypothetical protein